MGADVIATIGIVVFLSTAKVAVKAIFPLASSKFAEIGKEIESIKLETSTIPELQDPLEHVGERGIPQYPQLSFSPLQSMFQK